MPLLDRKYDGNGGLWRAKHPKIAAQGSIQIGGRKIALTVWTNDRPTGSDYNITVNELKMTHDDVVWFKSLSPVLTQAVPPRAPSDALTDAANKLAGTFDDDIPF